MKKEQNFFVHILYSQINDRYYIGQTQNVQSRFNRHESGYVKSTKRFRPWTLVHSERFCSRAGAMKRERELKSWKSKIKIKELVDTSR